jgi:ABC-2 type transport system ATP-binding protein
MGQKRQLSWDLPAVDTFEFNRVVFDIEAGRTSGGSMSW